jgi:UDP-N-acetylmuramate--alanine ligase
MEGVTSKIIFDYVTIKNKVLCQKSEVITILKNRSTDVVVTIGAGDIDNLVGEIGKLLSENNEQ